LIVRSTSLQRHPLEDAHTHEQADKGTLSILRVGVEAVAGGRDPASGVTHLAAHYRPVPLRRRPGWGGEEQDEER
jgi:hypothetical protein